MGWSIGYDNNWKRDIGYGVPATCDYPSCGKEINRGLSYVCGTHAYGGEHGCGLFFCSEHLHLTRRGNLCERCMKGKEPFDPTPDTPEWINWKLNAELMGAKPIGEASRSNDGLGAERPGKDEA